MTQTREDNIGDGTGLVGWSPWVVLFRFVTTAPRARVGALGGQSHADGITLYMNRLKAKTWTHDHVLV